MCSNNMVSHCRFGRFRFQKWNPKAFWLRWRWQEGELTIKSPLPNIQGHETIGRVVKLGEGRTQDAVGEPLKIGDRIMWAHADCGECYWCEIA